MFVSFLSLHPACIYSTLLCFADFCYSHKTIIKLLSPVVVTTFSCISANLLLCVIIYLIQSYCWLLVSLSWRVTSSVNYTNLENYWLLWVILSDLKTRVGNYMWRATLPWRVIIHKIYLTMLTTKSLVSDDSKEVMLNIVSLKLQEFVALSFLSTALPFGDV